MRVQVAVKGRFHAFVLAKQLQRRDALTRLITSYPASLVRRDGVARDRVSTVTWIELASRACQRLSNPRLRSEAERRLLCAFDDAAARRLVDADLCVAWSGSALLTLRRARELGMITILERGSCHIEEQRDLLDACHRGARERRESVPAYAVERELQEYRETDFICVPSSFARETFVARGADPARVLAVPLGVDVTRFSPPPHPASRFRVLHVGAVSRQKGCHTLVAAFRSLAAPGAELHLVGPVLPELKGDLASAGADVFVHGAVRREMLPDRYREAAVFCLASIQDGFAQVLLEAMASGLPIVASRNSAAPDVVRHGREGFLFDAGDVDALATYLDRLRGDFQLRASMGRSARRRALEFTQDRYGDRVTAAYEHCLRDREETVVAAGDAR